MNKWAQKYISYLFILNCWMIVYSKRCTETRNILRKDISAIFEKQDLISSELTHLKATVADLSNILHHQLPLDCSQAKLQGRWSSITMISPPGLSPREVQCDQVTDGGGWTVVVARSALQQNMFNPPAERINDNLWKTPYWKDKREIFRNYEDKTSLINFNRSWHDYQEGFGRADSEYWIGNNVLHSLTKEYSWEVMVFIEAWDGESAFARWDTIRVLGENEKYKLIIDGYRHDLSNLVDGLTYHNSNSFSTYDSDNDNHKSHCANKYGGGWWFHQCHVSFLTGNHLIPGQRGEHAVHWLPWRNNKESLKTAKMMIRPKLQP